MESPKRGEESEVNLTIITATQVCLFVLSAICLNRWEPNEAAEEVFRSFTSKSPAFRILLK